MAVILPGCEAGIKVMMLFLVVAVSYVSEICVCNHFCVNYSPLILQPTVCSFHKMINSENFCVKHMVYSCKCSSVFEK